MLGEIIGGATKLIGGLIGRNDAKDAQQRADYAAAQNIALQKEFAQHGIQWKVDDAKRAGIHPLYALGAQTTSFSPVSVGQVSDSSLPNALASAGQDISTAINRTRTQDQRDAAFVKTTQDLTLTKMGLENELLSSKVAQIRASLNPPMPAIGPVPEKDKFEERPKLMWGGTPIETAPGTTNMDDFSKRYGDEGLPSWLIPPFIMWEDLKQNVGKASTKPKPGARPGSLYDRLLNRFNLN